MNPLYSNDEILTKVFNALAHPSRLEILEILRDGEACVCHIQAMLNQRQAYVSQHLNVLRNAGLVSSRNDGLRVYYQVTDFQLIGAIEAMEAFLKQVSLWQTEELGRKNLARACTCPQCTGDASCQPFYVNEGAP